MAAPFFGGTMNHYHNSYFKVNMPTVIGNFAKVRAYVGPDVEVIPVVKGNCYGYGSVAMAKLYQDHLDVKLIANSAVYEAVELREAGITRDLLIIGGIPQHLLDGVIKYDLQMPLFDETTARRVQELASAAGKKVKVHIKVETGMNRLGVRGGEDLDALLRLVKTFDAIEIVGAYTHFATSTAEYDEPFALEQYERFKEAVQQIRDFGIELQYVHCCNSAAIAWFKDAYCTHVRSCSSVLGHMAMEDGREPIGLEEPCEIGAYITNIHQVQPGETIGYSRAYQVTQPMKVATLSIGFADGFYPKWMRGGGPVLVGGVKTKFLGCCMDQSFVDVTGIDCQIGDRALLIGRDGDERITTWDMEQFCENTFEYLYGTIGQRVKRIYSWEE